MRDLLVLAALVLLVLPASGEDRVLIMTISDYDGVPGLAGARKDASSARHIAEKLGFDTSSSRVASEKDLTLPGMRAELDRLTSQTGAGDRVFVYFSGHGSSYDQDGHCEQALLAQDGKPFPATQFAEAIESLRARARSAVLFLDACYSGGLAATETRRDASVANSNRPSLRPKSAVIDHCSVPANDRLLAALLSRQRGAINLDQNVTYIAAARDNEVALDADGGGLATQAVVQCMDSPDASGYSTADGLALGRLAECAQDRVEKMLAGNQEFLPPHLVLAGATILQVATPGAASNLSAIRTLQDLYDGRTRSWKVAVQAKPDRLHVRQDSLELTVTSDRGGYLYVLYVSSDQRDYSYLYPDSADAGNLVTANVPFRIPRTYDSTGPIGTDHILAIVSPRQRDFSIAFKGNGAAAVTREASVLLLDTMCVSGKRQGNCKEDASTRAISAPDSGPDTPDSNSYGAAMAEVVEE